MAQYKNKQELIDEINKSYGAFVMEFDNIRPEDIHKRVEGVDRTPSEMIAYQIGWLNHIMQWEKDELAGKKVETPAPGLKWNEMGKLYQQFYDKYAEDNLGTLLMKFAEAKEEFVSWIATLDEKTLFELDQRDWAYIKAGWPVWRWLHINSVAPFKSFRSKIRKWKKG
ncbi:ClbS/DfsB family four-helix bundle protein [Candidatus Saccharibacteria bacterium]|nr:ClbS/DfsB family four-helix bundle protein [Candidatus Saccharibacteria bacterium]